MRGFSGQEAGEEWDMLIEARPLDIDHKVDPDTVDSLFTAIKENPPEIPGESFPAGSIVGGASVVTVDTDGHEPEDGGSEDE